MTTVAQGGAIALSSTWYAYEGGPLADLDATPTIGIVNISTSAVALAPTTTGVSHTGTGLYGYTWEVSGSQALGDYLVTWSGLYSGNSVSATETVTVMAATSALYCTVDELKSRLQITNTDDEDELTEACFGASRWIDQYCERIFYNTVTDEARTFVPDDYYCLRLPEWNDLVSVTTFKTGTDGNFSTTWTTAQYQLLPLNPGAGPETRPYTSVRALGNTFPIYFGPGFRNDTVQITGVWGWPAVPYPVKTAARIIAAEYYRYKDAPLGAGGQGEFVMPVTNNSERAKAMLNPYRRNAVLVA